MGQSSTAKGNAQCARSPLWCRCSLTASLVAACSSSSTSSECRSAAASARLAPPRLPARSTPRPPRRPRTSAAWPASRPPARPRARSTSSHFRRTGRTTAAIIDAFKAKYGITVDSAQPDGSSQDEINAATQLAGTDRAPDVFDVGQSVAVANTAMFAPYQVATWGDIADNFKDPTGLWVNDYGGFMSIGYDASKVPAPTSLADLLKPEYKGKVALNGDPTQAGAAWNGVDDGLARQRRLARRHLQGRRLLQAAQRRGQLPARSTRRRPRSSPARPPSSSTGTTCRPARSPR